MICKSFNDQYLCCFMTIQRQYILTWFFVNINASEFEACRSTDLPWFTQRGGGLGTCSWNLFCCYLIYRHKQEMEKAAFECCAVFSGSFLHMLWVNVYVSWALQQRGRRWVKQLAEYSAAPGSHCSSLSQSCTVNGVWTIKLYTIYEDPPFARAVNYVLCSSQHSAACPTGNQRKRNTTSCCKSYQLLFY